MSPIDKKELKEWVENWFYQNKYYHPYSKSNNIPCSELYDILERMPTVDAVPVTRCAQCKWCDYPAPNSTKYGCRLFDRCVKGDWFCADGERRTDEQ